MNFEQFVFANEPLIRMGFFFGVFALVALWELACPRRALKLTRRQRWTANLGIVLLNTVIVRVVFPTAAVGMAVLGVEKGWGLLNNFAVPFWLAVPLAVVADLDYDLTTGTRFHPLEIVLSMGIKFATITLLGAPVLAVVVFEIVLSACATFNHGNIRLPEGVDRALRWFLVTPDMHRVHHSVEDDESNSNFGFNLTWWDRLFGTYREQPRAGQLGMTIGIHGHTDPHEVARLPGMLLLPFKGEVTDYAINRRNWTPPAADTKP